MSEAALLTPPWGELTPATAETVRQRVREAGVVGAGVVHLHADLRKPLVVSA